VAGGRAGYLGNDHGLAVVLAAIFDGELRVEQVQVGRHRRSFPLRHLYGERKARMWACINNTHSLTHSQLEREQASRRTMLGLLAKEMWDMEPPLTMLAMRDGM
jgi:hypothetical protein